jgi:hypothetical protein
MKRIEAIALLAGCVPLADRLAAQGVNIQLTDADRTALAGFNQVWLYEDGWWLDDSDIHRQAGLDRSDIGALNFMLARETSKKIQRQHKSGEQLD